MAISEETELIKMEIERDNALGLARGFRGEVECLKGKHEELMEVLRKERFDSASRLHAMGILKTDLEAMTKERDRQKGQKNWFAKCLEIERKKGKENAEVAGLFSEHLSESAPGDGNEWEEKARQIMWNKEDEKYEKDDGGRYRAENDFDTRDHCRER